MESTNLRSAIDVIKKLRDPKDGCPWDLEQTHQSLTKYMIEECYEYIEAVAEKDPKKMCEELGDVLLQVLLNSVIAEQEDLFTLEDVAGTLAEKMIERHPHVFQKGSNQEKFSSQDVLQQWQQIKKKKNDKHINYSQHLPALSASSKIGQIAKNYDFDWSSSEEVFAKVQEEILELKEEIEVSEMKMDRVADELGDVFFSLCQLARHLEMNPEELARNANKKFTTRFNAMCETAEEKGIDFKKLTMEEKENHWQEIKKSLKGEGH